jgi:hypothetical protein
VRAALLSGELFFASLSKPTIWTDAFARQGITVVDDTRGWTLSRGKGRVVIRRRDVVRLRLALAFIGMSSTHVADAVARLLQDAQS